jgi:hypothetical protein
VSPVRRVPLRQWLVGWELAAFAALIILIHIDMAAFNARSMPTSMA